MVAPLHWLHGRTVASFWIVPIEFWCPCGFGLLARANPDFHIVLCCFLFLQISRWQCYHPSVSSVCYHQLCTMDSNRVPRTLLDIRDALDQRLQGKPSVWTTRQPPAWSAQVHSLYESLCRRLLSMFEIQLGSAQTMLMPNYNIDHNGAKFPATLQLPMAINVLDHYTTHQYWGGPLCGVQKALRLPRPKVMSL